MKKRIYDIDLEKKVGTKAAAFLYQISYWSQKSKCGFELENKKYIYNTIKEWSIQLGCSKRSISYMLKKLVELGYIEIKKLMYNKFNRTNCICLTQKAIDELKIKNVTEQRIERGGTCEILKNSIVQKLHNVYTNNTTHNDIYNNGELIKNREEDVKMPESLETIKNAKLTKNGLVPAEILNFDFKSIKDISSKEKTIGWLMIKIWNLLYSDRAIQKRDVNFKLIENLNHLFKSRLKNDLRQWVGYLRAIKTSPYLMDSSQFNLRLKSICSSSFIDKIFNGELGVQNHIMVPEINAEEMENALDEINVLDAPEIEKELRKEMLLHFHAKIYCNYYKNGTFDWSNWDGKIYGERMIEFIPEKHLESIQGKMNSDCRSVFLKFGRRYPFEENELMEIKKWKNEMGEKFSQLRKELAETTLKIDKEMQLQLKKNAKERKIFPLEHLKDKKKSFEDLKLLRENETNLESLRGKITLWKQKMIE